MNALVDQIGFKHPGRITWDIAETEILPLLGPTGANELARWRVNRKDSVEALQSAFTDKIYTITPDKVKPFLHPPMEEWPFPAKDLQSGQPFRKEDWQHPIVEDMTGGFPLALGFQRFVEEHGRVPSWPDTVSWFTSKGQRDLFYDPAWRYHDAHSKIPGNDMPHPSRWSRAISWRIGNAYLSFLREMDFLSRMIHDQGIPLRQHIVVDSVLKVDFWINNHAICLWIPNEKRVRKSVPKTDDAFVHDVKIGDGTRFLVENGVQRKVAWNEIKQTPQDGLIELADAIRNNRSMKQLG